MTVGELKRKISEYDDNMKIVIIGDYAEFLEPERFRVAEGAKWDEPSIKKGEKYLVIDGIV